MDKSLFKPALLVVAVATSLNSYGQTSSSNQGIQEITITAQRRAETLQDAAIPVDAATGEELTRQGVTDATALTKVSPALTVVSGGGSNNVFFVRGVGNFAVNAYTDSALAFNVDGVFIGRPTATTASFLDLERVEVLKGPQGTLYGRNATAGAINLIPAKPMLGETSGYINAGMGNYDTREFTGALNIPLSDNWAARLSLGTLKNNGYLDDGNYATDDRAFRAQIFGDISDTVDARISLDYSNTEGTGNAPTYLGTYDLAMGQPSGNPNNVEAYNFNAAPAEVSRPFSGPMTAAAKDYFGSLTTSPAFTSPGPQHAPYIDNDYWGITAEVNVDLGFGDLVIIPAYREAEIDVLFNNPGFQAGLNKENHEQLSLETRLSTSTGAVDWIFGAYYFDETVDGLGVFNQHSFVSTQTINESLTESTGIFARGTFNVTDEFRLVGGIRWTDDKKTFDGVSNNFLNLCIRELPVYPGGPEIPNCQGAPVIPVAETVEETLALINPADLPFGPPGIGTGPVPFGQIPHPAAEFGGPPRANMLFINPVVVDSINKESEVTWRAAAEYDITPTSLLYTSYETGYRSGGFNLAVGYEQFAPEFLDAFTIGSKSRFLNNRLQVNSELFFWEYEDQQASHFGVDGNGATAFFTENIGESTIKGLEVDVLFAATDSLRVRANVQYLDNTIDRFSYDQLTPDEAVPVVTGCHSSLSEVTENGGIYRVDCSGQEGRNSPEWSGRIGIDKFFDVGGLAGMLSLDARYRDERWVGYDFTPPQRAESVTTFDASLELGPADSRWSLLAYVRNITDEDIKSLAQIFGGVSNLVSTSYEPPRTYGLRLNVNF